MAKIILLIGAPGSGKGTRGKICEENGCIHISSSRLLREAGYEQKNFKNIPHTVVIELLKKEIRKADNNSSIIIEGFPRNMEQVELLEREFEVSKVVYLKISRAIALERVINRIVCPNCEEIYTTNLYKRPRQEGVCDICGSELQKRDGDDKEIFKKRMTFFQKFTYQVIKYYAKKGKLITIDATHPNEEIITVIKSL